MKQDQESERGDQGESNAASGGVARSGTGRTTRDLPARPSTRMPAGDPAAAAAQDLQLQATRDATAAAEAELFGWGQVQTDGGFEQALTTLEVCRAQEHGEGGAAAEPVRSTGLELDLTPSGSLPPIVQVSTGLALPGPDVAAAAQAERAAPAAALAVPEAAPGPAAVGGAAPPTGPAQADDGGGGKAAKPEAAWVAGARAYNKKYQAQYVNPFNAATGSACVVGGEVDPEKVVAWQKEHGVAVDGRVGPDTAAAAKGGGAAPIAQGPQGPAPEPAAPAQGPAPVAAPTQAPTVGPAPVQGPAQAPAAPAALGEPIKLVLDTGKQKCLVFISPGGLTSPTPNIFLFLHGHMAQYGIDDAQKNRGGSKSGSDVAAEAMSHARGKNLISILPQGVIATSSITVGKGKDAVKQRLAREQQGGFMADLQAGLPAFLGNVLGQVAAQLQVDALAPGNISIAGHSAGGYMGMHDALSKAGSLLGNITDLTMMDANYSSAHFADAAKWMFTGAPNKSLRVIGSPAQIEGEGQAHYSGYLSGNNLAKLAAKAGCTVNVLARGDKRDNTAQVTQHSQVMKDGQVQVDILVLSSKRSHHQIRDDVMYDAMHSIGEGAAGSDKFGRAESAEAAAAPVQVGPESGAPITGADNTADSPDAEPEHGDNPEVPEKVVEAKADPAPAPAPKADAPAKGGKLYQEAGKEIYASGGRLSKEKLSRGGLGDAEFAFKKRVYDAATEAHGRKIYGGVSKEHLTKVEGGGQVRSDAAGPLMSLVDSLRKAVAAGEVVDGKTPDPNDDIKIGSTYRSPEVDFGLWDSRFTKYMGLTVKEREATGDPLGTAAVKLMVYFIGQRKAPPGRSNHSNGTAVDLKVVEQGKTHGNDYGNQKVWNKSWQLAWLKAHAPKAGFEPYSKEAWHWTFKG